MKLNALVIDPAVLGEEGWAYLERVCGMLPDLGVVVCTGRSTVAQRVRGLRLGVDDWVTKPCHPEEVIARIEAVVRRRRRSRSSAEVGPLVAGELEIRADQFQAFVSGDSLDLTRREFELLQLLAEAKGQVLEREAIYQRVWGYAMAHGDRSVDVFVRKLRQKLEKRSPGWSYIHTHFGVGYRFDPEPWSPGDRPRRRSGPAGEREPASGLRPEDSRGEHARRVAPRLDACSSEPESRSAGYGRGEALGDCPVCGKQVSPPAAGQGLGGQVRPWQLRLLCQRSDADASSQRVHNRFTTRNRCAAVGECSPDDASRTERARGTAPGGSRSGRTSTPPWSTGGR